MCTKWIDREYDYTFFGMKPFDDVLPTVGDQLFDLGSGIYVVGGIPNDDRGSRGKTQIF